MGFNVPLPPKPFRDSVILCDPGCFHGDSLPGAHLQRGGGDAPGMCRSLPQPRRSQSPPTTPGNLSPAFPHGNNPPSMAGSGAVTRGGPRFRRPAGAERSPPRSQAAVRGGGIGKRTLGERLAVPGAVGMLLVAAGGRWSKRVPRLGAGLGGLWGWGRCRGGGDISQTPLERRAGCPNPQAVGLSPSTAPKDRPKGSPCPVGPPPPGTGCPRHRGWPGWGRGQRANPFPSAWVPPTPRPPGGLFHDKTLIGTAPCSAAPQQRPAKPPATAAWHRACATHRCLLRVV